jgi:hypothetical protein
MPETDFDLESILKTPEDAFVWSMDRLGYGVDKEGFPYLHENLEYLSKLKSPEEKFRNVLVMAVNMYSISEKAKCRPDVNPDWEAKPKEALAEFFQKYLVYS